MPPGPTPRVSATDRAFAAIRERIVTLTLLPGSTLSENELAAELETSRTPVREAFIRLQAEGLIRIYPKVGTFVSLIDPQRIAEAQFVREAIETTSLRSLEMPLEPARLEPLEANLDAQEKAAADGDRAAFFELDEQFHQGLLELAGHGPAWRTVALNKAHLDRARRLSLYSSRPMDAVYPEHRAIATALADGDLDSALDQLQTHLRMVNSDVEQIRANHPELFALEDEARPTRQNAVRLSPS